MDGVAFHEFYLMAPEILCPPSSPSSSSQSHSTDAFEPWSFFFPSRQSGSRWIISDIWFIRLMCEVWSSSFLLHSLSVIIPPSQLYIFNIATSNRWCSNGQNLTHETSDFYVSYILMHTYIDIFEYSFVSLATVNAGLSRPFIRAMVGKKKKELGKGGGYPEKINQNFHD